MSWKPDITVAAVVERDGQFLLVEERVSGQLVFNQPAGHLEAGESLVEAAIRETLEETAWNFVPESVLGIYLWERQARQQTYLRVTFVGRVTSHDPGRPLDRGIKQALWLSREQIVARESHLRSPLVLKCIDDYLAGVRYPLALLSHLPAPVLPQDSRESVHAVREHLGLAAGFELKTVTS
jgi:8-oxo-dGTP pyrophosphatase MutT (NUDIX family)